MQADIFINYFLGLSIASSCIIAWFFTTFPVHIWKIFFTFRKNKKIRNGEVPEEEEIFTWEEWSDRMLIKSPFFGELLSCPICLSFWTSLSVAGVLVLINDITPWFMLACMFSWPSLIYFMYKTLAK